MSDDIAKVKESEIPEIGERFEFDYIYRDEVKKVTALIVVDVTDEHILYKMPGVSVNKVFSMTRECWIRNEDERRKIEVHNLAALDTQNQRV